MQIVVFKRKMEERKLEMENLPKEMKGVMENTLIALRTSETVQIVGYVSLNLVNFYDLKYIWKK